jgi:serine/threonine-protein kinase RsbW
VIRSEPPAGAGEGSPRPDAGRCGPVAQVNIDLVLPREKASVPLVRHILKSSLFELGVTAEDVADMELAVGEACANVVLHAVGAPDEYEIRTTIEGDHCEITVTDSGQGFDRQLAEESRSLDGDSGRGILLMRALVDVIRFDTLPGGGTMVRLMKQLRFDAISNGRAAIAAHRQAPVRAWRLRDA